MIVGIGLAIAQQVTGINTVIYYAPTIFKFAGLSSASVAILASVGVGVVNVVLTVVAMQLIDRVGRRPLLLVSLAGMALSLFVLGLAFSLPQLSGSLGWIAVASLMVYVGSFAVGLGPVFWLMLSEIYPLRIRGRAMSVGTVANWSANLIVALSFLTLTQVLGKAATFWLYAGRYRRGVVLCVFPRAGNQGKNPRTDRSALALRQTSARAMKAQPTEGLNQAANSSRPLAKRSDRHENE